MITIKEQKNRIKQLEIDIKILDQYDRKEGILTEEEINNLINSKQMEKERRKILLPIICSSK